MSFKTSDSLSRCDPNIYTNIYTATNRADIKVAPHQAISKDTISISREQLHNDAMRQIKQPIKFVIAQPSFMRIGKYVFLAIAFPPYLAVVELPKWILTQAIPYVLTQLTTVGTFIKKKMDPYLTSAATHVVNMWKVLQKSMRVLTDPVKRILLEIRNGWQRYLEKWAGGLSNAVSYVQLPFKTIRATIEKQIKKIGKQAVVLKDKAIKGLLRTKEIVQAPLAWMKELSNQMVILGFSPFTFFQQRVENVRKTVVYSQNLAKKMTDKTIAQIKKGFSLLKRGLQPVVDFYKKQWIPFWRLVKQFLARKCMQARDFFHRNKNKMKTIFEDKQAKLKKLSDAQMEFAWIKKFHGRPRAWLTKFFLRPTVREFCKLIIQMYCVAMLSILRFFEWTIKAIDQGLVLIAKGINFAREFYQTAKKFIVKLLDSGMEHGIKYSIASFYYFLLGATITGILCRWGMRGCGSLIISTKNSFIKAIRIPEEKQ